MQKLPLLAQEEAEHNPVVPIWQEVVIGAIAFGLLCWVLMKYVFPRMEKMYQARVEAIEGGIQRAEQAQAEANRLLERYRAQLAEAKTEAAMIRDDARADAAAIREDMLARAQQESDRIIAAGRESLTAERASLVRELRGELGRLSVDLASKIVGESLAGEARRSGTVERFLSDLESGSGDAGDGSSRDPSAAAAGSR